jgi:hypothetical protein
MLVIKKKKSTYQKDWYQKNKERIAEKRKKKYADDPEYREQRVEASRRYRRGERTPPGRAAPPDAPISFKQAAKQLGRKRSTLQEWCRLTYFPTPKLHKGAYWLTEHQVTLLEKLKECLDMYGKVRGQINYARMKEVRAFIFANWG